MDGKLILASSGSQVVEWQFRFELGLKLLERQIGSLEAQRRERLREPKTEAENSIVQLMRLGAIGPTSAWLLVMEFFGWRRFRNRRELAALAGLVGTPYNSGDSERDQGISKAANRRVRAMMVEIAYRIGPTSRRPARALR